MKSISKFDYTISVITVFSYLVIWLIFHYIFPEKKHFSLFIIPMLVYLITILLHHQLIKNANRKPQKFIGLFLGITGIKLISYLAIITIYVIIWTPFVVPFISIFFTLYILFTILEVSSLLKFLRQLK